MTEAKVERRRQNKQLAHEYIERIGPGEVDSVVDTFTDDGAIIVESKTLLPTEAIIRG